MLKQRTWAKSENEDLEGAISGITEMLSIQPDYHHCYTKRGIIRARLDDFEGAAADFRASAQIAGFNADLHNLLGHALMYQGLALLGTKKPTNAPPDTRQRTSQLLTEAKQHLELALQLKPSHGQAQSAMHHLLEHQAEMAKQ